MIPTFLRAYQDKETGKWKVGKRGKAIYDTKLEAERAELNILTERLKVIRDNIHGACLNYGN